MYKPSAGARIILTKEREREPFFLSSSVSRVSAHALLLFVRARALARDALPLATAPREIAFENFPPSIAHCT